MSQGTNDHSQTDIEEHIMNAVNPVSSPRMLYGD